MTFSPGDIVTSIYTDKRWIVISGGDYRVTIRPHRLGFDPSRSDCDMYTTVACLKRVRMARGQA